MAEYPRCHGDVTITTPTLEGLIEVNQLSKNIFTNSLESTGHTPIDPEKMERAADNSWWKFTTTFEGHTRWSFEEDFNSTISDKETMRPLLDKEFTITLEYAEENVSDNYVAAGTAYFGNYKSPDGTFMQEYDFDEDWVEDRTVDALIKTKFNTANEFVFVDDLLDPIFRKEYFMDCENEDHVEFRMIFDPIIEKILDAINKNKNIDNGEPYNNLKNSLYENPVLKFADAYSFHYAGIMTDFIDTLLDPNNGDWSELKTTVPEYTQLKSYFI